MNVNMPDFLSAGSFPYRVSWQVDAQRNKTEFKKKSLHMQL